MLPFITLAHAKTSHGEKMARQGQYPELDITPKLDKMRRELFREAAKRLLEKLKEAGMSSKSCLCRTSDNNVSVLHLSGLWGRAARWKLFLQRNIPDQIDF